MGWAVGYDSTWKRDIGYGVPSRCDHPDCGKFIDRGLAYVCGGEAYGGDEGCGLFFCYKHLYYHDDAKHQLCARCVANRVDPPAPFDPKPDLRKWLRWKLTHSSWKKWREENPDEVAQMKARLTTAEN